MIKLDENGNIMWQNTIGGNWNDDLYDILQTSDGGYISCGYSISPISGDKTEADFGSGDYWIVRLDMNGNIIWQNTIGGDTPDYAHAICKMDDNSYAVAGSSGSNVSGDKTEPSEGGNDFWIIKLFPEQDCLIPTGIVLNVLSDKVKVTWDAVAGSQGYKLRYRISGTELWNVKYAHGKEFAILKSLACGTSYEFQIMAVCAADGTMHSAYSSMLYFTTNPCRLQGSNPPGELLVFPNPASGQFNISLSGETGDAKVFIYNANGTIVYENFIRFSDDGKILIDAGDMNDGIYQLIIFINANKYDKKIMLAK